MYIPRRDIRFEYVWDAIANLESHSCYLGCTKALSADPEYPGNGCELIDRIWMMEGPVEEIDDRGDVGLYCTVREPLETIGQGELF